MLVELEFFTKKIRLYLNSLNEVHIFQLCHSNCNWRSRNTTDVSWSTVHTYIHAVMKERDVCRSTYMQSTSDAWWSSYLHTCSIRVMCGAVHKRMQYTCDELWCAYMHVVYVLCVVKYIHACRIRVMMRYEVYTYCISVYVSCVVKYIHECRIRVMRCEVLTYMQCILNHSGQVVMFNSYLKNYPYIRKYQWSIFSLISEGNNQLSAMTVAVLPYSILIPCLAVYTCIFCNGSNPR